MKFPRAHHLPLDVLAGQILMPVLNLKFINRNSREARKIFQMVSKFNVGGFHLFGGHPADIRYWTDALQKESQYPPFFCADLQQGLGSKFSHGTVFPHALCFGAANSIELIQNSADIVVKEVRAVGINLIFAPNLGLANNSPNQNADINSWHHNHNIVAEFGKAYIKESQKYGIACAVKGLPLKTVVNVSIDDNLMQKLDIIPFLSAMESNVMVITIEDSSESKKDFDNILRKDWQFKGLLFGDIMNINSYPENRNQLQKFEQLIKSGIDVIRIRKDLSTAHQFLLEQIKRNENFRKRVEQSVERIFRMKKWIHKYQPAQTHPNRIYKVVEHPNHVGFSKKVAEKGITLLHKSKKFPFDVSKIKSFNHIIFTEIDATRKPLELFCEKIQAFGNHTQVVNPDLKAIENLKFTKNTLTIISFNFNSVEKKQQMIWNGIKQILEYIELSTGLLVICVFGNPYQITNLKENYSADAIFLTYSDVKMSQEAAFKALCGLIDIEGKLPVKLPKPFDKVFKLEA